MALPQQQHRHQPPRLLHAVLFHAFFAGFGDLEANVINYMSVPFRQFLVDALRGRGVEPGSERFELIHSAVASSFFVGVFCAGMSMAYCMERFGRKGTAIYVRSTLGIVSASAMLLANWSGMVELFVVGHFLAGALATLKTVLFIYLAECAPDHSRGWSATALGSGGNLLLLFVSPLCLPGVFGNSRLWWMLPALCLVLAMVHLFVASYLPESPKHLFIGMGQRREAEEAVRFYHGSSADIDTIFEEYEQERLVVHRERVGLREFWESRRLRWSLALSVMVGMVPAFSLLSLKSQYLESMLMRYGLDQSAAMVSTMIMTALGTPFSLLAPFLVEWKGRRPLFLSVTALSCLELALLVVAQALFDLRGHGSWPIAALALLSFALGQTSCSLGILNMNPILVGELFPHKARAKAVQMSQMPPMLAILGVVLAYPSLIARIGTLFLLPLLMLSLLLLCLMWRWLPETKGLPVDEIFRKLADSRSSSLADYGSIGGDRKDVDEKKNSSSSRLIAA